VGLNVCVGIGVCVTSRVAVWVGLNVCAAVGICVCRSSCDVRVSASACVVFCGVMELNSVFFGVREINGVLLGVMEYDALMS